MARRKRLSLPDAAWQPASSGPVSAGAEPKTGLSPGLISAPIARVAAEATATAALAELSEEMTRARAEGRFVQAVPLAAVAEDHLVRDRVLVDDAEMAALSASLRARGQQTPIEVADLGAGRFGLISGWRRLMALRRLHAETGEARFATVQALIRRPSDASDAYVAMVEENEIRVGLSYYERARIVLKAVDQGVYRDENAALRGLFSTASRAKRSKIGTFGTIVRALDGVLRFPGRLAERAGLQLAYALAGDRTLAARIAARLAASPPGSAEEEQAMIAAILAGPEAPRVTAATVEAAEGVLLSLTGTAPRARILLSGPAVGPDLADRLAAWLAGGAER